MILAYSTLFVAITISVLAEYYSIIGLTTLFPGSFWPIVIMGASLGVGKITAAIWLKINWGRASIAYKLYLVPAVMFLMFLTSMGCFGYLSKAHNDHLLISGDVQAKIALYEEKIKISRDNIETNRRVLKQMDEAVEQVLGRSTSEQGAARSATLRRQQTAERNRLIKEIADDQAKITSINEEIAPIRAQIRKVEKETGPLKYIAALIYGDNPDANLLESAVRWVIIMIVIVFDPLALVLILAAQQSWRWSNDDKKPITENTVNVRNNEPDGDPKVQEYPAYLKKPWAWSPPGKPIVAEPLPTVDVKNETTTETVVEKTVGPEAAIKPEPEIAAKKPINADAYDAYTVDNLPDANRVRPSNISFGETAPKKAVRGDLFIGTKSIPHTVLKFDGMNWRRVDKNISTGYLLDRGYLSYLVQQLESGNYDVEFLTEQENAAIEEYLLKNKSQAK